ncbi:hypothetical protein QFC22_003599 [Naganishia vaughanmartiniae]|uniref:Uncharacterized protein n=1 Tax=Naganishia vaughanmartiniae TaxID=1424756 RepID=A0ACC2X520_9TREE|nr:hypothetical protein QFC22_003599 [Naganishia vaughanmartiniae]
MSSITGAYPSPSKPNGLPPALYLGLNGDISHQHRSPPDHGRSGSTGGHAAKDIFYRVDTVAMKKQLLGAIGDDRAAEYWSSLALFLKGMLRREEFEALVQPVLNSFSKRQLHNQLLTAIMYNASSTLPIASTPTLPTDPTQTTTDASQTPNSKFNTNPLKRPLNDPGEPLDVLEPKSRIRQWVLSLPRSERKRIKALQNIDGRYGLKDWCEMSRGWQGRGRVRSTNTLQQNEALRQTGSPLCMSTRAIPPINALGSRIDHMATLHGLPDGVSEDLGTFMSVALDYHLSDMISSAIELKRRRQAEEATVNVSTVVAGEQPAVDTKQNHERSPDNVSDSLRTDADDKMEGKQESPKNHVVKLHAGVSSLPTDASQSVDAPPALPASDSTSEKGHETPPAPATISLADLEDFFTVVPHIHPHLGSATYRLRNGLARAVEEQEILAERFARSTPLSLSEPDAILEEPTSLPPTRPSSAAAAAAGSPVAIGVLPPSSSGTNSQSVTRGNTPSKIHRKGAPTSLSLPLANIPTIEVAMPTPEKAGQVAPTTAGPVTAGEGGKASQPPTPRLPLTSAGGIVLTRTSRKALHNPTEAFRLEMEARGILKSMDRAAGVQGGLQGVQQQHGQQQQQHGHGHADAGGGGADERQLHGHHWNYVDPAVILKDILG